MAEQEIVVIKIGTGVLTKEDGTLDGGEINQLHESVIEKIRQETGGKLREG